MFCSQRGYPLEAASLLPRTCSPCAWPPLGSAHALKLLARLFVYIGLDSRMLSLQGSQSRIIIIYFAAFIAPAGVPSGPLPLLTFPFSSTS